MKAHVEIKVQGEAGVRVGPGTKGKLIRASSGAINSGNASGWDGNA